MSTRQTAPPAGDRSGDRRATGSVDRRRALGVLGGGAAVAALLARSVAAGRAATRAATPDECPPPADDGDPSPGPNLYELNGPSLTVTYSTSGIAGEPQLVLTDADGRRTFAGVVIRAQETELGRLVTVELEHVPDLATEKFGLLLPAVGPVAVAPEIAALAIYATEQTTPPGAAGGAGAIHRYRVVELTGVARSVTF